MIDFKLYRGVNKWLRHVERNFQEKDKRMKKIKSSKMNGKS
jgi:hypothetical protein